jgi:hypothetical protein
MRLVAKSMGAKNANWPLALALAGWIVCAVPAFAETKPPMIANSVKAEQPYGTGTLRWFLIPAYDASLWTDAIHWSMQAPFALALTYHMSFSSHAIVERSLKEMKYDDPSLSDAVLADYRTTMSGLFPDVEAGDRITGLYTLDGTARFFRNGRLTGQVHDPAFARAFFGIWLSPQTSEPELRAHLLHLKE